MIKSWRFWLLVICMIFSVILINPQFGANGVVIKAVATDSVADLAGIEVDQYAKPTQLEKITQINSVPINSLAEYYAQIDATSLFIETDKGVYTLTNITSFNGSGSNLGLEVQETPSNNIKTGIELSGGIRILLEPDRELESAEINTMKEAIKRRLNVFGLADITVRFASGASDYFVVEMASSSLSEVEELLSRQGKFEARIGNNTAYSGEDIILIDKDPLSGAGVATESCGVVQTGEYGCQYQFPITLSQRAAQNMADLTRNLTNVGGSLSQPLLLFLDEVLVNDLSISSDLGGRVVQNVQISGFATGASREDAIVNAQQEMIEFMGLLESGNLPAQLSVVKADRLSPTLGATFIENALLTGFVCLLFVSVILYVRYRRFLIVIPAITTVIAEVILLLGFAALSGWNIDVAAIAGFLIILGTGLDHLIIITDESLSNEGSQTTSMKGRLKRAFRVIMTAFFTTLVAMFPLYFAGAGLLQGFATTTIIGLMIAIFITRPAYGVVLESYLNPKTKD